MGGLSVSLAYHDMLHCHEAKVLARPADMSIHSWQTWTVGCSQAFELGTAERMQTRFSDSTQSPPHGLETLVKHNQSNWRM
eukprot:5104540-Amphidinium_carterae.1